MQTQPRQASPQICPVNRPVFFIKAVVLINLFMITSGIFLYRINEQYSIANHIKAVLGVGTSVKVIEESPSPQSEPQPEPDLETQPTSQHQDLPVDDEITQQLQDGGKEQSQIEKSKDRDQVDEESFQKSITSRMANPWIWIFIAIASITILWLFLRIIGRKSK